MTKRIELSRGKAAIVDDEDYDALLKYSWYAQESRTGRTWYAVRRGGTRMHRQILRAPKGKEVDHINGNGLDNRRENLRLCTHRQNTMNRRALGGSSRFQGVSWRHKVGKWRARIKVKGKSLDLGHYDDEEIAARAYDTAARFYHGEFASTNFDGELAMPAKKVKETFYRTPGPDAHDPVAALLDDMRRVIDEEAR